MAWDCWKHPFDTEIAVDGETRLLQVARLSVAQKANFHLGLARLMGARGTLPEGLTPDEQEQADTDRRRENTLRGEWLESTVTECVRLPIPWLSPDGIHVNTAEDLVQAYPDETLLTNCVLAIWTCNSLTAAQRKNLRSPSDLLRSLAESPADRTGESPAPTVENVEPSASVVPVTATAFPLRMDAPTGGTET